MMTQEPQSPIYEASAATRRAVDLLCDGPCRKSLPDAWQALEHLRPETHIPPDVRRNFAYLKYVMESEGGNLDAASEDVLCNVFHALIMVVNSILRAATAKAKADLDLAIANWAFGITTPTPPPEEDLNLRTLREWRIPSTAIRN